LLTAGALSHIIHADPRRWEKRSKVFGLPVRLLSDVDMPDKARRFGERGTDGGVKRRGESSPISQLCNMPTDFCFSLVSTTRAHMPKTQVLGRIPDISVDK
jgi:hypothetical protein